MMPDKNYFTKNLLAWNRGHNKRAMPWKGEKDPYKIWLSEIILQQTRVEQGLDYYNRFVKIYPRVEQLARAPKEKVFKLWEGLGYYTRCRNLIETARFIAKERDGKFPDSYEDILALKGVGPYTAAAIASFAFNLPHAVVDGNVFRVLSRFFGIQTAVNSTKGKRIFESLAGELLDKRTPGVYNQAIMDFGAMVCKPKNPLCSDCVLRNKCVARLKGLTGKLPLKTVKTIRRKRFFNYLVVEHSGKFYVHQREGKDIWQNLYEFILLETKRMMTPKNLLSAPQFRNMIGKTRPAIKTVSGVHTQQLTHQSIRGRFFHLTVNRKIPLEGYKAVTFKHLKKLPFPKLIAAYLSENDPAAFDG